MNGVVQRERRLKRQRGEELKARDIVVARRYKAWCVQPEAVLIPQFFFDHAMKGLSGSAEHVWLRPGHARALIRMDVREGGTPRVTEAEYRICPICKVPRLQEQAADRRRLDESCRTGRMLPCGAECLNKHWRDKGILPGQVAL